MSHDGVIKNILPIHRAAAAATGSDRCEPADAGETEPLEAQRSQARRLRISKIFAEM